MFAPRGLVPAVVLLGSLVVAPQTASAMGLFSRGGGASQGTSQGIGFQPPTPYPQRPSTGPSQPVKIGFQPPTPYPQRPSTGPSQPVKIGFQPSGPAAPSRVSSTAPTQPIKIGFQAPGATPAPPRTTTPSTPIKVGFQPPAGSRPPASEPRRWFKPAPPPFGFQPPKPAPKTVFGKVGAWVKEKIGGR